MERSGFICICPPKAVVLGADRHLHRDEHTQQLHAELDQTADASNDKTRNTYAFLPGGGVRAINPGPELTLTRSENCFVICKGHLTNRPALIARVGGEGVSDAELLRLMYVRYGVDMLGRLEGQFAFCLYDSKLARVLAARDPSGSFGLVEGRTPAGSLLICCGTFLPDGAHDVTKIHPGEYKYGWHALPRPYLVGPTQQVGRVSLDHGIRRRSTDAHREHATSAAVRNSFEGPATSSAAVAAAQAAAASMGRWSFDLHSTPSAAGARGAGGHHAHHHNGAGQQRQQQQHGAGGAGVQHHNGGGRHHGAPAPHGRQRRASSPGGRAHTGQRSPVAPAAATSPHAAAASPIAAAAPLSSSPETPGAAAAAAAAAPAPKPRRNRHRRRRHSHSGGPVAADAHSDDGTGSVGSAGSRGSRGTHDSAHSSSGRNGTAAKAVAAAARAAAAAAAGPSCVPSGAEGAMLAKAMEGLAC